jgi:hypothetical protein
LPASSYSCVARDSDAIKWPFRPSWGDVAGACGWVSPKPSKRRNSLPPKTEYHGPHHKRPESTAFLGTKKVKVIWVRSKLSHGAPCTFKPVSYSTVIAIRSKLLSGGSARSGKPTFSHVAATKQGVIVVPLFQRTRALRPRLTAPLRSCLCITLEARPIHFGNIPDRNTSTIQPASTCVLIFALPLRVRC